jgi:hypothetical protein
MENSNLLFVSYDADSAGQKIGRAILSDDPIKLKDASDRIVLGNELFERWANKWGGKSYSSGGDQGLYAVPIEAVGELEQLRSDYAFSTGLTVTVGVGKSLSESGKALLVGKFRGKNTLVQYDHSVEDEISQAQSRISQGSGSPEEQKLGEAYLKPEKEEVVNKNDEHSNDCPYCKETEEESPCPYCGDAPIGEASSLDDCPYCMDEDHEEECPYCARIGEEDPGRSENQVEPTDGPTVIEPTTTSSENYEDKGLHDPALPKPQPGDQVFGLGSPSVANMDNQADTNSNRKLDVKDGVPVMEDEGNVTDLPPDDEFGESPQDILTQLDDEGSDPTTEDAMAVQNMDDADLAPGDGMQGNVSRPEGYSSNRPKDMGLGEEEEGPDLSGVLQEGLDDHAESAQREKIVQMTSEALEGFKACKQILEKAKEQAPQLYKSSISMLRAMIEMAKMLGLNENTGETAEEVVGEGEVSGQEEMPGQEMSEDGRDDAHDWEKPFPKHPDHGGEDDEAAQGDAEEDPKLRSR